MACQHHQEWKRGLHRCRLRSETAERAACRHAVRGARRLLCALVRCCERARYCISRYRQRPRGRLCGRRLCANERPGRGLSCLWRRRLEHDQCHRRGLCGEEPGRRRQWRADLCEPLQPASVRYPVLPFHRAGCDRPNRLQAGHSECGARRQGQRGTGSRRPGDFNGNDQEAACLHRDQHEHLGVGLPDAGGAAASRQSGGRHRAAARYHHCRFDPRRAVGADPGRNGNSAIRPWRQSCGPDRKTWRTLGNSLARKIHAGGARQRVDRRLRPTAFIGPRQERGRERRSSRDARMHVSQRLCGAPPERLQPHDPNLRRQGEN